MFRIWRSPAQLVSAAAGAVTPVLAGRCPLVRFLCAVSMALAGAAHQRSRRGSHFGARCRFRLLFAVLWVWRSPAQLVSAAVGAVTLVLAGRCPSGCFVICFRSSESGARRHSSSAQPSGQSLRCSRAAALLSVLICFYGAFSPALAGAARRSSRRGSYRGVRRPLSLCLCCCCGCVWKCSERGACRRG